jgi:hypothetical protein
VGCTTVTIFALQHSPASQRDSSSKRVFCFAFLDSFCTFDISFAHTTVFAELLPLNVQIRVIVERLVRRCGYEAVAAACPPGDAKLLSHIRKQTSRKERRKAMGSEGGSQVRAGRCVCVLFV